jgi:hypothetical protein
MDAQSFPQKQRKKGMRIHTDTHHTLKHITHAHRNPAAGLRPVIYLANGQFPEAPVPNPAAGIIPIAYNSNGQFPKEVEFKPAGELTPIRYGANGQYPEGYEPQSQKTVQTPALAQRNMRHVARQAAQRKPLKRAARAGH